MPTIYRLGNIEIRIYPMDHRPAHVHAVAPDAEAKLEIETLKLISNYGFSERAIRKLQEFLKTRKDRLQEKWDDYQK